MSTLKKILALTLAIAMVLSLNVFAAFNDQDKINEDCVDAMELMNALGIIKGDDKGNANPTSTITRAEAAAMIFRLMNKGNADASIYNGMKVFTDVPAGIWYEGYVNYAYTMGIVQGRTATTFDPQAPVTGYEIAKMLLTCAGYNSEKQGYTGANWAKKVQNDAFAAEMLGNYGMALSMPAQRQWVAVMFMDAMDNTYMVKYLLGELNETEDTLGVKKFNYEMKTGVVTAIGAKASLANDVGTAKKTTVKIGDTQTTFKKIVDASLLGQKVKVYYKAGTETVYAILAHADNTVGTSTVFDAETSTKTLTADTKFTVGDLEGKLDSVIYVVNNANRSFTIKTAENLFDRIGARSAANLTAIDNDDDGKIEVVIESVSNYGEIDITSKGVVTLPGVSGTISADEVEDEISYVGTVKDGDVVKMTANPFTGMYVVEALKAVDGTVTRIYTANEKYALDGNVYRISADAQVVTTAMTMSNDVTVYVDGSFIVKAGAFNGAVAVMPENIGLVLYKQLSTKLGSAGEWEVVLMSQDGKINNYVVASDTTSQNVATALSAQASSAIENIYPTVGGEKVLKVDLVKYTVNSDGTLKLNWPPVTGEVTDTTLVDYTDSTFTAKNDVLTVGGNSYRFANDAKIFVAYKKAADSTSFTFAVMKASDFTANQSCKTGFYYTSANGFNTITLGAMILTNENNLMNKTSTVVDGTFVYATSAHYDVYDKTEEETYRYVDVIDETGKEMTLKIGDSATAVAGKIYSYTTTDDVSTLVDGSNTTFEVYGAANEQGVPASVKFTGLSGNAVMFGGGIQTLASDVKVLTLNKDKDLVAGTIEDIFVNTEVADDQASVIYVVDRTAGSKTLNEVIFVVEK